jgi:hypothetical protein
MLSLPSSVSRRSSWLCGALLFAAASCVAEPATFRAPEASIPTLPDASQAAAPAASAADTGPARRNPTPVMHADAGVLRDAAPADAGLPSEADDDAGPYVPPDPKCVNDAWLLAPGFLPAKRVDYIADRTVDGFTPSVLSSLGVPCATALDRANCQASLLLEVQLARHLLTTAGDSVRLWPPGAAALEVLGAIDTPAEALWWLSANRGYALTCATQFAKTERGIEVRNFMPPPSPCQGAFPDLDASIPASAVATVLPNGEVNESWLDGGQAPAPCTLP